MYHAPMYGNALRANRLRTVGRVTNALLGCCLVLVGLRLYVEGGAGWCPFQGASRPVASSAGVGFVVGGLLLFPARTALVGLFLSMGWTVVWTWTPLSLLWGGRSCWQAAIGLSALFFNMGILGMSDGNARPQRMTKLVLFFAVGYLAAGGALWLRSR